MRKIEKVKLAVLTVFVVFSSLAKGTDENLPSEIDAKVNLSRKAFEILRVSFENEGAEVKRRGDLSFEAYANAKYLLAGEGEAKDFGFRIKSKLSKNLHQVEIAKKVGADTFICGQKNKIILTERVKEEHELEASQVRHLKQLNQEVLTSLLRPSNVETQKKLELFHQNVEMLSRVFSSSLASDLRNKLNGQSFLFVSSTVQKDKDQWEFKTKVLKKGQIEFKLIRTLDIGENGQSQERYQMEAEPVVRAGWQPKDVAKAMCDHFGFADWPESAFQGIEGGGDEYILKLLNAFFGSSTEASKNQ